MNGQIYFVQAAYGGAMVLADIAQAVGDPALDPFAGSIERDLDLLLDAYEAL